MTDPLRPIASAIDDTIGQLDGLHAAGRGRRATWLSELRGVVARLDAPGLPDEAEPVVERPQRDDDRRPTRRRDVDPDVDDLLPQRSRSRGGPFGPQVRDRLIREALRKSDW